MKITISRKVLKNGWRVININGSKCGVVKMQGLYSAYLRTESGVIDIHEYRIKDVKSEIEKLVKSKKIQIFSDFTVEIAKERQRLKMLQIPKRIIKFT